MAEEKTLGLSPTRPCSNSSIFFLEGAVSLTKRKCETLFITLLFIYYCIILLSALLFYYFITLLFIIIYYYFCYLTAFFSSFILKMIGHVPNKNIATYFTLNFVAPA